MQRGVEQLPAAGVFRVVEGGGEVGCGRLGHLDPGAAAAVAFFEWERERWLEAVGADEGDVDALGLVVVETLLDDGIAENVQVGEAPGGGEVGDESGPFDGAGELKGDLVGGRGRDDRVGGEGRAGDLLVEPRREKQESVVLELEAGPSLGDAALADENALPTRAEGVADDGPLFKCHDHKCCEVDSVFAAREGETVKAAMRYRFDLHVHSFFSSDAASSPESLVAAAKKRGLDGIAITDHNSCRAGAYCLEKGLMNADGTAVDGFLIVPGVEVSTADGHLLCIGVTLPDMIGVPAVEVERAVLAQGGVAIPAHPFDRWRAGIRPEVLRTLRTPVIEVFNAAVTARGFNHQALAHASERGLVGTAASDAHHASAVGTAVTSFEMEDLSVAELLRAIPKGGEREERYLTRVEGFKKHFGNWFRVFNPAPRPAR